MVIVQLSLYHDKDNNRLETEAEGYPISNVAPTTQ